MKKFLKELSEEWFDYTMLIAMIVCFVAIVTVRDSSTHTQPSTQNTTNCSPADPK